MKPTWTSDCGTVQLYRGDCLDVLPGLEGGSVGMALTDPPYGIGYSTGYRIGVSRPTTQIDNDKMVEPLLNDTADAVEPLLNDTAALYWFCAPKMLPLTMAALGRWDITNVLVWDKGNCAAGDLDTTYGQQWEAIVYARVQRVPLIGGRDRDVIRFGRGNTSAYVHPTQKPDGLMRYLIGRHEERGAVLDPFMGSGTTGVACCKLGRRFIGIEIDEKYFEIAKRRIKAELAQGKLFVEPGLKPEQMKLEVAE